MSTTKLILSLPASVATVRIHVECMQLDSGILKKFLSIRYSNQNPDTIIQLLQDQKINVYELLDQLVSYLTQQKIAVPSLKLYMTVVRSYLEYNDIDISISKFKRKVKMPRFHPDQEEPLSLSDIRELLEYCSNTRLRCYLLVQDLGQWN